MRRVVLVCVALAACAAPPTQAEIAERARVFVDELVERRSFSRARFEALSAEEKAAVVDELARRTIVMGETLDDAEFDARSGEWREAMEAARRWMGQQRVLSEPVLEVTVWASAHAGHSGIFTIWKLGTRSFPALLRMRRDRHLHVHMTVAGAIGEFVLCEFRNNGSNDAQIAAFCRSQLETCSDELKSHYRALLAAIGDSGCLDAIPNLLESALVPDNMLGLWLTMAMFEAASPIEEAAIHEANHKYLVGGENLWPALTTKVRDWWTRNRDAMSYEAKSGHWRLSK